MMHIFHSEWKLVLHFLFIFTNNGVFLTNDYQEAFSLQFQKSLRKKSLNSLHRSTVL